MRGLRVGICEKTLTVMLGEPMIGYAARTEGAIAIHDNLKVKCLLLEYENEIVAFVTCDLLALEPRFVEAIKARIEGMLQIPKQNVIIVCTHTHSGPVSLPVNGARPNEEWLDDLCQTVLNCVKEGLSGLSPAILEFRSTSCSIGYNRVLSRAGVSSGLREIDPQVGILTIRHRDSREMMGIAINYACHPVALTATNLYYSADYPGYLEIAVKREFGDRISVFFWGGCAGDIDPIERGSYEIAEKHGEQLGQAVLRAISHESKGCELEFSTPLVTLQRVEIPLRHDLDKQSLLQLERVYMEEQDQYRLRWVQAMIEILAEKGLPRKINTHVTVVRLGKLSIVCLPFEVFHDVGLSIKELYDRDSTMVVTCANGVWGYLPSKNLYSAAKYEVGGAHHYYLYPGPIDVEAEDILIDALTTSARD